MLAQPAHDDPVAPAVLDPTPVDEQVYRSHVTKALAHHEAGRYGEALIAFERAWKVRANARVERGMALALFELRKYAEAFQVIERALQNPLDPLPDTLRGQLLEVQARARAELMLVHVRAEPAHAELRVDGRVVPPEQRDRVILEPGTHVFSLAFAGAAPAHQSIEAVAGGEHSLVLTLKLPPPTPGPVRIISKAVLRDAPSEPLWRRRNLWISTLAFALALEAASVTGLLANAPQWDLCQHGEQRGATCTNYTSVRTVHAISWTGVVSGAVLSVGAALMLARTWQRARSTSQGKRPPIACAGNRESVSCGFSHAW